MNKNIFVIGDIVIDHSIFVDDSESDKHQSIDKELICRVTFRQNTAGGAANTARILTVANTGRTFLWGVLGDSSFGSFRSILEDCRALDGASQMIDLRGVKDETDAPMHTISRIISNNNEMYRHIARFDDYGAVHISQEKRLSAISDLEKLHKKHKIDAIVIHDLDLDCLKKDIVKKIAKFACSQDRKIPIIVDPKRDRSNYDNIKGMVIMPNLREWCHLIDQPDKEKYWRTRLDDKGSLIELAKLSLFHLGNFKCHIIKCDKDGAVIVVPNIDDNHTYFVYRIMTESTGTNQPGCGDVIAGLLALELENLSSSNKKAIEIITNMFSKITAYRIKPWLQMPNANDLLKKYPIKYEEKCRVSKGVLFLPKQENIFLSENMTQISDLYSIDKGFNDVINNLLIDIRENWNRPPNDMRSLILGAPAGSGKSMIMDTLKDEGSEKFKINAVDVSDILLKNEIGSIESFLKRLQKMVGKSGNQLLLMMDEALKEPKYEYIQTNGVELLNKAHKLNIRFLFIDARFTSWESKLNKEFDTRCEKYILPPLKERLADVSSIAGARFLKLLSDDDILPSILSLEPDVLLAIIDDTLKVSEPSPRDIVTLVDNIYKNAKTREGKILIKYENLPNRNKNRDCILKLKFDNYKLYY